MARLILAFAATVVSASAQERTQWKAPVTGSWVQHSKWSNGAPCVNSVAVLPSFNGAEYHVELGKDTEVPVSEMEFDVGGFVDFEVGSTIVFGAPDGDELTAKGCLPQGVDADCAKDSDCISGSCDGGNCAKSEAGDTCDPGLLIGRGADCVTDMCGDNLVCLKGAGEVCSVAAECGSEDCANAKCAKSKLGDQCAKDSDCDGGVCAAGLGRCLVFAGGSCSADADCTTGTCTAGKCAKSDPGEKCAVAEMDCTVAGSVCSVSGICQSTVGERCSKDPDCTSSNCKSGSCGKSLPGAMCAADGDCDESTCSTAGRCVIAAGDDCTTDDICVTQACGPNNKCKTATIGGSCKVKADCGTDEFNVCDQTSFTCIRKTPEPTASPTPAPTVGETTATATTAAPPAGGSEDSGGGGGGGGMLIIIIIIVVVLLLIIIVVVVVKRKKSQSPPDYDSGGFNTARATENPMYDSPGAAGDGGYLDVQAN